MPAANDLYYPGTVVVEKSFQPTSSAPAEVAAFGAFVGKSDQGPLLPTEVTSFAEFSQHYGTNYGDFHTAVNDFFNNGGRRAFCVRLEGNGAEVAVLEVLDTDAPDPPLGTETPLFTATATSPGVWGNQLRLVTFTRDAANHRFDVALYRLPQGVTAFDETARNTEFLVDQWLDVSLYPDDPRNLYTLANAPSQTGSKYVSISGQTYDLTTATRPMPGVNGGFAFTGGVNGSYTTPFDPVEAYAAAVSALTHVPGPFVLNLPNVSTAGIIQAAIQFAAARGDVFVVVDPPAAQTPAQAVTYAETDIGLNAFGSSVPSYGAVYYPWVTLPAIGATIPGRTALRPPGGAVVGAYMAVDAAVGPFRAPAGAKIRLAGAVSLERQLEDTDLALLNAAHVNALRVIPGNGIAIMGARTLKKSGKDKYVNARRALIDIRENLKNRTAFAIFENNGPSLWDRVRGAAEGFLAQYWQRGGLVGSSADEAFFVRCDDTNNTQASIDQGVVNLEVGVALTSPAEFIIITIGQHEGGASVTTQGL
jgi:hypothetical protein